MGSRKENFVLATKKSRFEQEKGICEWCKELIDDGLNFKSRQAHYHHKLPIFLGGTKDPANCVVLHRRCHFDPAIFEKLHGFPFKAQKWYKNKKQMELFEN